jgi:hypothetical protein
MESGSSGENTQRHVRAHADSSANVDQDNGLLATRNVGGGGVWECEDKTGTETETETETEEEGQSRSVFEGSVFVRVNWALHFLAKCEEKFADRDRGEDASQLLCARPWYG